MNRFQSLVRPLLPIILLGLTVGMPLDASANTFVVTNNGDVGAGTLREAITSANNDPNPDVDEITFDIGSGTVVITPTTALPALNTPMRIRGFTQPPAGPTPRIVIDGSNLVGSSNGFILNGAGCFGGNCYVEGLNIINFPGNGIRVQGGVWYVRSNWIGVDLMGNAAGNGYGVRCVGGQCYIGGDAAGQGNVISGSQYYGVQLDSDNNLVNGNLIGLSPAGDSAIPNLFGGVRLVGTGNYVGGFTPNEKNVISGNGQDGVSIAADASGSLLVGNWIGLDASGSNAIGNDHSGVSVLANSVVYIGLNGYPNVVSGNLGNGISVDSASDGAIIEGNLIGTNPDGTAAVGNGGSGITLYGTGVLVGGDQIGDGNLISGNTYNGILIFGMNVANITVTGNKIGTNLAGTSAIGNAGTGIRTLNGTGLTIGGTGANEGNLLSGNGGDGLSLEENIVDAMVLGNRIGTNAAGTGKIANLGSGIDVRGPNVTIGGSVSGSSNLISGNTYGGIAASSAFVANLSIKGNLIGTNAAGTTAIANSGSGIRILDGVNVQIGGTGSGEGNLISGNSSNGISLEDGVDGATVYGNLIGTNLSADAAVPNGGSGIALYGHNITIGGPSASERNLISGNGSNGISVSGTVASSLTIAGNRIGTRPNGTIALGNGGYGIRVVGGQDILIGGDTVAKGNLVSGNDRGISVESNASTVTLTNNIVGLNVNESAKLPNGSSSGIDVSAPDTQVGAPGQGNVVAGNGASGIKISYETAVGSKVQGNFIGTNRVGAAGLGNHLAGIQVDYALLADIGGFGAGEGNEIAYNEYFGVMLRTGEGISILGNSIHDNAHLGINIDEQGPNPNDAGDPDGGPNQLQNFPVITSAQINAGTVTVEGFLDSVPSQTYMVEVFHNTSCDPSGVGEGEMPIGHFPVTTDGSGLASFSQALTLAAVSGTVTALATAEDGSTSEFSPCHALGGPNPGQFQIWRSPLLSWEGAPPLKATIVRSLGNSGAASVTLTTSDDSAFAPGDYMAVTQQVDFADGEVLKTVEIPIVADNIAEGQEQFHVTLSNATGGASLGAQADVNAIIINTDDFFPMYYVDSVAIDEPASGQANLVFTVTLTPTDSPRTITYDTQDGTAIAGLDYVSTVGQLDFPASTMVQSQTVSVPVLADDLAEAAETFYLHTSSSGQIAVYASPGIGTIHASAAGPSVFADGFED